MLVGSFLGLETCYSYPEAAEEDLKKWERSYRKLSPAHKVIFCCISFVQRQTSYCVPCSFFICCVSLLILCQQFTFDLTLMDRLEMISSEVHYLWNPLFFL